MINEPWVQLPADSLFGSMVIEVFRAQGHEPPRPTVVTHSEYLKNDFLAKGRFLTVLPSFMLKVPGWYPPLRALPIPLPATRALIGLITLKGRTLTPLAQLFIDNIRQLSKPMGQTR